MRDISVKDSSLIFHVCQTVGNTPIVPFPASDLREKVMDDTFIKLPEHFGFINCQVQYSWRIFNVAKFCFYNAFKMVTFLSKIRNTNFVPPAW
jgi:hypothetical protein